MITVSPSLLSCDFLNIEKEMRAFSSMKNLWFHLDIMDGHFVPNLTFGHAVIKPMSKVTKHPLDAHLMVTNPSFYLESFKGMNLHNITIHFESCENPLALIKDAKKNYPSVGISLRPKTPISVLSDELLSHIDLFLMMSVEPGFGGQAFIEETYPRLLELKKRLKKKIVIQVDGGVTNENAKKLIDHGVTNLVAGSFIFKSGEKEYKNRVESLRTF